MPGSFSHKIWPLAIKLKDNERTIRIEFEDGFIFDYKAEYLRVESPTAPEFGYSGISQKEIVLCSPDIKITTFERIGKYAVRIAFNDNEHVAIYSWDYLYDLGHEYESRWQRYRKMLEALGLSRKI